MKLTRAAAIVGLIALLAGCAGRPVIPGSDIGWAERERVLGAIASWELNGRMALRLADEGAQGSVRWQQGASESRLTLSGPFGAGGFSIEWNDAQVTIERANGDVVAEYRGKAALERFIDEQIGWPLPAEQARYWALGLVAPGSPARRLFDADGWLAGIAQDGWQVEYAGFRQVSDQWLPRKVTMRRDATRMRLVIDRWQPAD